MTIYKKYYLELKNRFTLLLFTWLFGIFICYLYKDALLFLLIESSKHSTLTQEQSYFIFTNVSEVFYVYLELIFFVANQTVILMLFYHLLLFLATGLYNFEFIRLKNALQFFIISWVCSIILLYKFVIPYTWEFFLSFQQTENDSQTINFFFEAKIAEYLKYFIDLYYICLLNCQLLAVVILVLTNLSKTYEKIKSFRKLFYFVFVIFSTLTTPPDIVSQAALSLVLILIYELLVFTNFLRTSKATS